MANVTSWELEIKSSSPASKVFQDFCVGLFDFLGNYVLPASLGVTFTTVQGDGGVGTIKQMSYGDDEPSKTYKVKKLDIENFTYVLAVIEGEGDEEFESTVIEMRVIPSDDGGCTFIQKSTEYKGIDDGEIEFQRDQVTEWFKTFEATLTQDFNSIDNDY